MTTKKSTVSPAFVKRFMTVNEQVFAKTAYSESHAYAQFKDLSLMQVNTIRLIEHYKPCTMSTLAKSMGLTMGSVTQLIDRLIERKYVKRIRSTEDRRVVYAELTAKGKKVIQATRQQVEDFANDMLSKFTTEEQENILDVFERMHQD
jgi:DNA-binding MarR family transcriptional regulator